MKAEIKIKKINTQITTFLANFGRAAFYVTLFLNDKSPRENGVQTEAVHELKPVDIHFPPSFAVRVTRD